MDTHHLAWKEKYTYMCYRYAHTYPYTHHTHFYTHIHARTHTQNRGWTFPSVHLLKMGYSMWKYTYMENLLRCAPPTHTHTLSLCLSVSALLLEHKV